jgi:cyanophycin synthetase
VPLAAAALMARGAYELGMPVLVLHGAFLQAGYGASGVALTGSITENTSSIGVHLAREKSKANALLARAGFPIAEGGLVRDLAHARQRAETLGYPVVVKPADRDGGAAVSSDLRTPAELEQAFARARAASPRGMVEKHIDGTDHRLLLFGDELLVTIERTPGGVTGNGKDTVARLLDALNRDPKRGDGPNALLHRIAFDDEARLLLRRQGLTPESVPEKDRFVPLRRAANHALGGMVRLVDEVHPDNVDLARRAMRLLRLDIAGLDLILPDVTRSWRETGGAICEVNAQPYIGEVIGRDYYKAILQKLVPSGGRIPLVLAVGAPEAKTLDKLAQTPGLTIVDTAGARRAGRPLSAEGMPWPTACQAALYDRETTAALFVLDPGQPIPPLSPADRFTAALVLEPPPEGAEALLRRADTIHALDAAGPALRKAGLKFKTFQRTDVANVLATALSETNPRAATKAPARRGTAPPAPRKRR